MPLNSYMVNLNIKITKIIIWVDQFAKTDLAHSPTALGCMGIDYLDPLGMARTNFL